jgi:hypothetical protein
MTGPGRRFDPSELLGGADGDPTESKLADAFAAARALEAHTPRDQVGPTEGFEDRVMAAIATEPAPRVVVRPRSAGGGIAAGLLAAIRDSWGILTGSGRSVGVRAQALGLLLLAGVALTSLVSVALVGVGSLLGPQPTAIPSVEAFPTPSPTVSPPLSPSPSATETASPTTSSGSTPTAQPTETSEATETPEATETSGPDDTADPGETLKPAETLRPGETLRPAKP